MLYDRDKQSGMRFMNISEYRDIFVKRSKGLSHADNFKVTPISEKKNLPSISPSILQRHLSTPSDCIIFPS